MKKHHGFSIIEVLIASLLTATTAMLLLKTESIALKSLRDVHFHAEALMLADGFLRYQCLRQKLKLACLYPAFLQAEVSERLPNGKISWKCTRNKPKVIVSWHFVSPNRLTLDKHCG